MLEEERQQVYDLIVKYPLDVRRTFAAVDWLLARDVPLSDIMVWIRLQGELKTLGICV